MQQAFVTIKNKLGLHARPAAHLVKIAAKYKNTSVEIVRGADIVNAKSILGVMMLAAGQGSEIELRVEGLEEEACLADLIKLVEQKFYEE